MLHSSIVASESAGEVSTRAVRHRQTQVLPSGSYDFGEGDIIPSNGCISIEPMPVDRLVKVNPGAVPPGSLAGSALPSVSAVMPSGQMRGLGDPLGAVPFAFRHGVSSGRKALSGNREVRRVGNALVPMAAHADDVQRDPIMRRDRRPTLNRSGTTGVLPSYGMAPDDRLRVRAMKAREPGEMLSRPAAMTAIRTRRDGGAMGGLSVGLDVPRLRLTQADYDRLQVNAGLRCPDGTEGIPPTCTPIRVDNENELDLTEPVRTVVTGAVVMVGVAALLAAGGLYWYANS